METLPQSNKPSVSEIKSTIQKTHKERINLKKEQSLLQNKINKETDIDKRKTLLKEYVAINETITQQYISMKQLCR